MGGGGTVMWVCASLGFAKLTRVLFLIFVTVVLCGYPVYCLSFIAGERLAMGSVEQEKKKNNTEPIAKRSPAM